MTDGDAAISGTENRHPADEAYEEVVGELEHNLDIHAKSLKLGAERMRKQWREADRDD